MEAAWKEILLEFGIADVGVSLVRTAKGVEVRGEVPADPTGSLVNLGSSFD